ncbi:unnamed protein product [Adineta steineri]|uniref:G-protein coupled receptors family 1 profile domain-containing protein n=1 Tax=Adineta steineri TaxID=433720 RepID=A0A818P292_9BILA|nr:unnamed protein product [Adineta steineri]
MISLSNNTNNKAIHQYHMESFKLNRIKFFLFLTLQVCTMPCFVYAFYRYVREKKLRKTINYHVIYLLLCTSFLFVTLGLSLSQIYMFTSYVYPSDDRFCSLWNWFHHSINIINLFFMAFLSIERNILIFHSHILRTKRAKILFHYCPILFCLLFPPLFYIGAIFLYPCTNHYDYTKLLCTSPCYFNNKYWANIDLYFNNYIPLFIIPIFCGKLYINVILQRRRLQQQRGKWRRDRKMILQLWIVSTLYLCMWMPLQITTIVCLYWNSSFLLQAQIDYMYLFPYFIHIIYPFILLFLLSSKNLHRTINRLG